MAALVHSEEEEEGDGDGDGEGGGGHPPCTPLPPSQRPAGERGCDQSHDQSHD